MRYYSGMGKHEDELYDIVKHGSTPTPETATGDNEGHSTPGTSLIILSFSIL